MILCPYFLPSAVHQYNSVAAVVQDMLSSHTASDPFALVKGELENVSERLRRSILTDIPVLGKAASYFFQVQSTAPDRHHHYPQPHSHPYAKCRAHMAYVCMEVQP